ncbi:MAG: hypothetical protein ACP5E5_09750 [Acidobacteriaceae bacterium]
MATVAHGLEHGTYVAAPLRLVSEQRARHMKDARGNKPAGTQLEPVGLGVIQNPVVSLVPTFQAAANIIMGGPGLKAEVGMREVAGGGVELGGK